MEVEVVVKATPVGPRGPGGSGLVLVVTPLRLRLDVVVPNTRVDVVSTGNVVVDSGIVVEAIVVVVVVVVGRGGRTVAGVSAC
jgi:hypothetical protein